MREHYRIAKEFPHHKDLDMLEHIVLITPAPIHLLEFLRATAHIAQINLDISEIITV